MQFKEVCVSQLFSEGEVNIYILWDVLFFVSLNIYTSCDEGESKYKQRVKIISDTTQQNDL